MGKRLRSREIVDVLIPLLSKKWQQLNDQDKRLLPLFECFEQVIHAVGHEFIEEHVGQIYERCLRILKSILESVRIDPKDAWSQAEAFFLRAMELVSVILLPLSSQKATQLIAHMDNLLLSLMVEFAGERSVIYGAPCLIIIYIKI